jgi:hypothetical protein
MPSIKHLDECFDEDFARKIDESFEATYAGILCEYIDHFNIIHEVKDPILDQSTKLLGAKRSISGHELPSPKRQELDVDEDEPTQRCDAELISTVKPADEAPLFADSLESSSVGNCSVVIIRDEVMINFMNLRKLISSLTADEVSITVLGSMEDLQWIADYVNMISIQSISKAVLIQCMFSLQGWNLGITLLTPNETSGRNFDVFVGKLNLATEIFEFCAFVYQSIDSEGGEAKLRYNQAMCLLVASAGRLDIKRLNDRNFTTDKLLLIQQVKGEMIKLTFR